jgi:hypothetical protein
MSFYLKLNQVNGPDKTSQKHMKASSDAFARGRVLKIDVGVYEQIFVITCNKYTQLIGRSTNWDSYVT